MKNFSASFLMACGIVAVIPGCLHTCSISPETSDYLHFSNSILDRMSHQRKRFMAVELWQIYDDIADEMNVNGKLALIVMDNNATRWAVHDPYRIGEPGGPLEKSTWMWIDPENCDFQVRNPIKDNAIIRHLESLCSEKPFAILGTNGLINARQLNVLDTQQVYDAVSNCRAIFIRGKDKFQVFSNTSSTLVAYQYRDALFGGYAWPPLSRCIAQSDDFVELVAQIETYYSTRR